MNKKQKKSPVSAACGALGTAILIFVIAICIPFTLPRIMGGQIYTVISGSMEPSIPVGSLIYVEKAAPEEIEAGAVIAFYGGHDSNAVITHRVVENHTVMGEFITKGDANPENDINPIPYNKLVGLVAWSLPKLGIAAQLLTETSGKLAAGSLIAGAVVLHILAAIFEKNGEQME